MPNSTAATRPPVREEVDDNGNHTRKYVRELEGLPKKYIFEPHKVPIQNQKKAGVVVQGDDSQAKEVEPMTYSKPKLDFNEAREVCIRGM